MTFLPPIMASQDSAASQAAVAAESRVLRMAFLAFFFVLIFMQKTGLGFISPGVSSVQISNYAILAAGIFLGFISVSAIRLVVFGIFYTTIVVSQFFIGNAFSIFSLLFLFSLYFPLIFEIKIKRNQWKVIISDFQNMMVFAAGMVFVQLIWQIVFHQPALSIERFIPESLSMGGYMYTAPIHWGQPLMRPNGIFFLEPSFVSAFCAIALIFELSLLRRPWRLVWYAGALFASTGATGMFLVAISAPFLIVRLRAAYVLLILAAGLLLGAALLGAGVGSHSMSMGRLTELGDPNSSGFGRLVAPLIEFGDAIGKPNSFYTGAGAGNIDQATSMQSSAWPIVKLQIEYGFVSVIAFLCFLAPCFWRAPEPALAAGMFFIFNFTGGYLLNPMFPVMIFAFVSAFRLIPPAADFDEPLRAF